MYNKKLVEWDVMSPSTRRVWIEMSLQQIVGITSIVVTLHTEGVD